LLGYAKIEKFLHIAKFVHLFVLTHCIGAIPRFHPRREKAASRSSFSFTHAALSGLEHACRSGDVPHSPHPIHTRTHFLSAATATNTTPSQENTLGAVEQSGIEFREIQQPASRANRIKGAQLPGRKKRSERERERELQDRAAITHTQ